MSCFLNIACQPFKVLVRAEFMHNMESRRGDYELGVAHRVVVEPGHCLRFMVLTERGALFHGLPLHALCMKPCDPLPLHVLSLWNAMSYHAVCYRDPWRSGLDVDCKLGSGEVVRGECLLSVDYAHAEPQLTDGGWSAMPEEHKEHHVCVLESGHLAALPGNRLIWLDASFVTEPWDLRKEKPTYKTNTHRWSVEGHRRAGAGDEMFYDVEVE